MLRTFLNLSFQGVPFTEGNGMSSLYKLQVKLSPDTKTVKVFYYVILFIL